MLRTSGCLLMFAALVSGADLPGSRDPAGMKRYEGSEIIGYREPKFDDFLLPLGTPTEMNPPAYTKSLRVDGQISRYTYIAPAGRTSTELLRNYKLEFQRLGLETLYEKRAGERGWFGPTFEKIADEDGIGQILAYHEADEQVLVGKSKMAAPSYYLVFVTSYNDGMIPHRLEGVVQKGRALAEIIAIIPDTMEKKMTFVNADEIKRGLHDEGRVALYGIYFDTDKDTLKAESSPTIAEIVKLMKGNAALKLRVVGHTDNQGKADYNLDLSRRRAASVMRAITAQGIAAERLDSFGCGLYAPVASNETEKGRAQNRRVELTNW